MLTHLSIRHLAVVEQLELQFNAGMTVLTGETGAGKSILMDALGLTLGERSENGMVRANCPSAEVSAVYDLNDLPSVLSWLKENLLDSDEECVIRRTVTEDGKSKAYINGRLVPINQLRQLGEQLVNIHGQHQHQTLLKPDHQRILLDEYANHPDLLNKVRKAYFDWQDLKNSYAELKANQGQSDKLTLLQYQIQEIEELKLQTNELQTLEIEHKQLAHAEEWFSICENTLSNLKNESGMDAFSSLYQATTSIAHLKANAPKLASCHELLSNSLIQLEEAIQELNHFKESLEIDPNRLSTIDQRLSQIHALSRKHRIKPDQILEHQTHLATEISKLTHLETHLATMEEKLKLAEQQYCTEALALSRSRKKVALELEKKVTDSLKSLEMQNGQFKIAFQENVNAESSSPAAYSPHGIDTLEFLVSTNPGLPLQPLRKIASGGELSRISLAIQVITAQSRTTPTLIFDEVDAGISGKTAETVGKLMRKVAGKTQVLCVTHLPQVAAQGHHHYKVEKKQTKLSTTTHIVPLSDQEKIQELARLLGGATITKQALAHAEEMLQTV